MVDPISAANSPRPNLNLYFCPVSLTVVGLLGHSLQKVGLLSGFEKEVVNTGDSRTTLHPFPSSSTLRPESEKSSQNYFEKENSGNSRTKPFILSPFLHFFFTHFTQARVRHVKEMFSNLLGEGKCL